MARTCPAPRPPTRPHRTRHQTCRPCSRAGAPSANLTVEKSSVGTWLWSPKARQPVLGLVLVKGSGRRGSGRGGSISGFSLRRAEPGARGGLGWAGPGRGHWPLCPGSEALLPTRKLSTKAHPPISLPLPSAPTRVGSLRQLMGYGLPGWLANRTSGCGKGVLEEGHMGSVGCLTQPCPPHTGSQRPICRGGTEPRGGGKEDSVPA